MTRRKYGHRSGFDAHPKRFWMPDIGGHRQKDDIVRGKGLIGELEARFNAIRAELLSSSFKGKERG